MAAEKWKSLRKETEEEISPVEDLMREHGILHRILLIYQDAAEKLKAGNEYPIKSLLASAEIVRRFVEDYHEKTEETHVFPRFEKARVMTDLVLTLHVQHQAGRRLTDQTIQLSTSQSLKNSNDRKKLTNSLEQFIRMYRPHMAREDTVLFPAIHGIVSPQEYDSLGEKFEEEEEQLIGEGGFEKTVNEVAQLEKVVTLHDLSIFTPILND